MDKGAEKVAKQIGWSMLAGIVIGLALYFMGWSQYTDYIKPIGTLFIKLLKMVIIPLVFSSIFMAILHLGTPQNLSSLGRKAIAYYFITTAVAVFIGLVLVNLFQPGAGVELASGVLPEHLSTKLGSQKGLLDTIMGVLMDAVPSNPVAAMSDFNVLQIIVFAIIFGLVALYHKEKSKPVSNFIESLEHMSLELTHGIMKLAPIGIFVLMVHVIASSGLEAILSLGKYMFVVIIGLAIHACVLLALAAMRLKKSPLFIIKNLAPALMTAFSTSSSAATLPLTMSCVEDNIGVRKDTAKFVLPLGATINMDGTALYESVAVIFISQAYGMDLSLTQQIVVFLTASLAAVGAAAIPGAGLITMSIVLGAVGLPLEGIGLILAVDRILDMFRTTVNVFGDCVGTIVVDSFIKD